MTNSSIAAARVQHLSHASLIESLAAPIGSQAQLDAIIVPAGRPANQLLTAIDLAKQVGCYLIVLCSLRTRARDVRRLFDARSLIQGIAVDIPHGYALPGLDLETTRWAQSDHGKDVCGGRKSDLSVKRNVGLLMARMLGWQNVFFMDDDIRGLSRQDLARTVSPLDPDRAWYKSAGIRVKDFPDNSVVCHARRIVGDPQDVFVSGAALAVKCTQDFAFFPETYNEDWLFFYPDVAARKMASPDLLSTKMQQMSYRPFAYPQRAAWEEFGDLIAEGLYSLLHDTIASEALKVAGNPCYWSQFLDARLTILKEIDLRADVLPPGLRTAIKKSVDTAWTTLAKITPDICASYIRLWEMDIQLWRKHRDKLPPAEAPTDALARLSLTRGP